MTLPKTDPTSTKAWQALAEHFEKVKDLEIKELFGQDPLRAKNYAIKWEDFLVDFSKNRIDDTAFGLLLQLADEVGLKSAMESYFGGAIINETEGRAVLHTALRSEKTEEIIFNGKNVVPEVHNIKQKVSDFAQAIISGEKKGYTGKAFTDVVNIGIGGSDLGPVMVTEALQYYTNHLRTHFMSNVDGDHVHEVLKKLNPETTLFVIVSKSFTTQETLTNAQTAKKWFLKNASEVDVAKHFVAVSANLSMIKEFGIDETNVFPMWDWVGGRFSLWSAVGISIALAIGPGHYEALLDGAHAMDRHFKESPFKDNIPIILALIGIWYTNFYEAETEAVIPYTQYLHRLPAYLQQAIMESNGKAVDRNGKRTTYQTGNIIWGEPGTNSQHAFFQLIHQGTKLIPADFIGFKQSLYGETVHHNKLMANFFAQTEALMKGKSKKEVETELASSAMSAGEKEKLIPFKVFEGNKPTNSILIEKLTPKSLGALVALYEHKIFVQGVIWNIFSYDQWGVELGKKLAKSILNDIESSQVGKHDSSTVQLVENFKN